MSGYSGYVICWTCNGNGIVNVVRRFGPWGTAKCPDCKGTGRDDKKTAKMYGRSKLQ